MKGETHRIRLKLCNRSKVAPLLLSHRRLRKMAALMEDEVFLAFTTYATIVIVKMMLMGPMTGYYRFTRRAFANEEDVSHKSEEEKKKLLRTHPDVERVRRCHQNDLENIVPFLVVGLLYALTAPDLSAALLHFRLFCGSRIFHTVSYEFRRGKMETQRDMMESEIFKAFSTYATIVILKMMLMSPLTSYFRLTRKVFANLEDTKLVFPREDKKLVRVDPAVERVRRCHQNDLENIVPFLVVGLLYALTAPDLSAALLHFRLFCGSRIFHTVSYVLALPQPCRGLSWMLGMLVTFSMAYRVLSTALHL
ncbi:hypothetical protein LDENG_00108480 [Lucifuga dentata]|nr:hypothetical protein LDENG_00108480 [Lucifuga dentata]